MRKTSNETFNYFQTLCDKMAGTIVSVMNKDVLVFIFILRFRFSLLWVIDLIIFIMRIPDPDPDDCLTMRSKESEKICLHSTYLYQSWKSDEKILDHNQKELKIDDLTVLAKCTKERTYVTYSRRFDSMTALIYKMSLE